MKFPHGVALGVIIGLALGYFVLPWVIGMASGVLMKKA